MFRLLITGFLLSFSLLSQASIVSEQFQDAKAMLSGDPEGVYKKVLLNCILDGNWTLSEPDPSSLIWGSRSYKQECRRFAQELSGYDAEE